MSTMHKLNQVHWTAFEGYRLLAAGEPSTVAIAVKRRLAEGPDAPLLVFERETGQQVDVDLRGSVEDVERWVARVVDHVPTPLPVEQEDTRRGPGRRRLGVVSREVTLLPRHWEWLATQPGGASATLRRLVDEARVQFAERDRTRISRERSYRFMSSIGGNLPNFEEATRALFANDRVRFQSQIGDWPPAIREFLVQLADESFEVAV